MRADVLILEPNEAAQQVSLDLPDHLTIAPKISCIMATRGGAYPARLAINCFRAQNYPNSELIIACATTGSELEQHVAQLQDRRIAFVSGVAGGSVGELRNAAIERATGDYLCVWDDDDLSHPSRLTWQFGAFQATEARATFLARVLLWWPVRERIAVSGARIWENTMLVARDALSPYPALRRGSDTIVAR